MAKGFFYTRGKTKMRVGDLVQVDDPANLAYGRNGIVSGFGLNAVVVRLINDRVNGSVSIHPMFCKFMETRAA